MKNLPADEVNLLRCNARRMVRELGLLNDAYFDIGVTLAERHLLIELNSCLYPTIGEIAERLLIDKTTASRLIAKAVAKGYIDYASDGNDKRKRFLQFTEAGRRILDTFEPIAFNQTRDALLTLTADEIQTVYRGIELYAKGLKRSRLRSKVAFAPITAQDNASLAHLLTDLHKGSRGEWANLFESYQRKGSVYFVMIMETKIIGGLGLVPHKTNGCQMEQVCLQSDMRDLGFEKILLDFCIGEAQRLGFTKCFIDAAQEILFSSEFLQQQGFELLKNKSQGGALLWKAC
jgi:putative acetyltransferase